MISLAVSRPPENLSTSPKELSRTLKLLMELQKSSVFRNKRGKPFGGQGHGMIRHEKN